MTRYSSHVRKPILLFIVLASALVWCSNNSSNDGGVDASGENIGADICDLDAFIQTGGNGHACPKASATLCFPICEAGDPGGCQCKETDAGLLWVCTNPEDCHPCGNSSPFVDAECPDADDDAEIDDAGDAEAVDASDAGAGDASDAGDAATD